VGIGGLKPIKGSHQIGFVFNTRSSCGLLVESPTADVFVFLSRG
jgi:hypothetical protein